MLGYVPQHFHLNIREMADLDCKNNFLIQNITRPSNIFNSQWIKGVIILTYSVKLRVICAWPEQCEGQRLMSYFIIHVTDNQQMVIS